MQNEVKAALIIYDCDDRQRIDYSLGIKADDFAVKNNIPNRLEHVSRTRWKYNSRLPKTASVEEHIISLIEKLRPRKEQLASLAQEYRAVLIIAADWHQYNPEIELSAESLTDLGQMGLNLWLDMYTQWNGKD